MARKSQHLRVVKGAKHEQSALDKLFSGRLGAKPRARSRKKEPPPIELPKKLQKLSDLFASGRALEKEVRLKADFARQQLERFCLMDVARQYTTFNRRPSSRNFSSPHSRFKFVLTERTTLTQEKLDELQNMDIPISEYTEVRGIKINYDAIRQHHLESKLRDALASMHVSTEILEEVFAPEVQLKPSFYEMLSEIVKRSLGSGEDLEQKIEATLEILNPATQIRNVEVVGLTARQVFDLVNEAEIETSDLESGRAEDEIA